MPNDRITRLAEQINRRLKKDPAKHGSRIHAVRAIARWCRVSPSTVQSWWNGWRNPSGQSESLLEDLEARYGISNKPTPAGSHHHGELEDSVS